MTTSFRDLPSVSRILEAPEVQLLAEAYSREAVTGLVRQELERARQSVAGGAKAPFSNRPFHESPFWSVPSGVPSPTRAVPGTICRMISPVPPWCMVMYIVASFAKR